VMIVELFRKSKQLLLLRNDALDFIQHIADVRYHIRCGETDDVKAILIQPRRAALIVESLRKLSMLIAVHLDNEPNRQAAEVREISSQRKLAAETVAVNCFAAKMAPKLLLSF
jgi:hypothetical protein